MPLILIIQLAICMFMYVNANAKDFLCLQCFFPFSMLLDWERYKYTLSQKWRKCMQKINWERERAKWAEILLKKLLLFAYEDSSSVYY